MLRISSDQHTTLSNNIHLSIITNSTPYQVNQYITQLKVTVNINNSIEYKRKLITIYNDINNNSFNNVNNQTFSGQVPPKIHNNTERIVHKQRGGKRFNKRQNIRQTQQLKKQILKRIGKITSMID